MLKEAENIVKVEGILAETDLKYGSYTKNGQQIETIGGTITVNVDQVIDGVPQTAQIPVHMFSGKYTKAGKINPSYESIERVMKEFKSIAATGSVEEADKIRITSGYLRMNEYYNTQTDKFVSFPRVHSNFVNKATGEFNPQANFSMTFAVSNIQPVVDSQGVELDPKQLEITVIVPYYGGKVDIMKLRAKNPNVVNAIEQYWSTDDTFKANGRLEWFSKTEKVLEEVDFGEPIEKLKTTSSSDIVITGGSQVPLDGDFAFDQDELVAALRERKARLEEQKNKSKSRTVPAPAPAPTNSSSILAGEDLGF